MGCVVIGIVVEYQDDTMAEIAIARIGLFAVVCGLFVK